jgi:hypothetical protein
MAMGTVFGDLHDDINRIAIAVIKKGRDKEVSGKPNTLCCDSAALRFFPERYLL